MPVALKAELASSAAVLFSSRYVYIHDRFIPPLLGDITLMFFHFPLLKGGNCEEVRAEMYRDNEEVHNMCVVLDRVEERGIAEGENKLGKLIIALNNKGRKEDIILASTDAKAREALYKEFNIF